MYNHDITKTQKLSKSLALLHSVIEYYIVEASLGQKKNMCVSGLNYNYITCGTRTERGHVVTLCSRLYYSFNIYAAEVQ